MYSIVDLLAKENITKAFKHYGIEGTEQVIRRVYKGNMLAYMLKQYQEIVRGTNVDD